MFSTPQTSDHSATLTADAVTQTTKKGALATRCIVIEIMEKVWHNSSQQQLMSDQQTTIFLETCTERGPTVVCHTGGG